MSCLCKRAGAVCSICGKAMKLGQRRTCRAIVPYVDGTEPAKVRVTSQCPHLLDPLGESVLLFGCGCASSKSRGVEVSVWSCRLHERCVRQTSGTRLEDETIKRCVACADRPK